MAQVAVKFKLKGPPEAKKGGGCRNFPSFPMDAPLEGIRPGSIIQGYRVQKLLGSGSFGAFSRPLYPLHNSTPN